MRDDMVLEAMFPAVQRWPGNAQYDGRGEEGNFLSTGMSMVPAVRRRHNDLTKGWCYCDCAHLNLRLCDHILGDIVVSALYDLWYVLEQTTKAVLSRNLTDDHCGL